WSQAALTSGLLMALLMLEFRNVMTSLGVPLGAITPSQMVASYPGTVSAIVGKSGVSSDRVRPVVPSARTCPPFASADIVVTASNIICTVPEITLLRASPEALWGTCTMSLCVIALNNSPAMWYGVPGPDDA